MFNLTDIMQAAQGGQAMVNLARQFGLSPAATQRAVQALLPAFSMGLQRHAQTPTDFASMLGLMSTGQFAPFFEEARPAAAPNAMVQDSAALEQIFGTPEVGRQVAAHAAVLSGVPTEVLVRMLPIMGALIMGGLFKAAMEKGYADLFRQVSEAMQKSGFPLGFGAAAAVPESETHAGPAGDVFAATMTDMFKGMFGAPPPDKAAPPREDPSQISTTNATQASLAQLTQLFETGSQVQRDYAEAMQKVFGTVASKDR